MLAPDAVMLPVWPAQSVAEGTLRVGIGLTVTAADVVLVQPEPLPTSTEITVLEAGVKVSRPVVFIVPLLNV